MKYLLYIATFYSNFAFSQVIETLGSGIENMQHDAMPETQRMYYWHRNKQNQEKLLQQQKLSYLKIAHPLYQFPLKSTVTDAGFYGISNFVDLDPTFSNPPTTILDYNCGTRSYDTSSGYNHRGIDFFSWPYGWDKMDNNAVTIHAVAAGTITDKIDNNPDRSCSFNVTTNWNYVAVTHIDGSYVWYGHMKAGSLTGKSIGSSVAAGEYLGVVGSSGISTGPHLHLETHTSADNLIEPFAGTCNNLNVDSWWQSQQSYYQSEMSKIATHSQPPNPYPACNSNPSDTTNYQDFFTTPATIYLARYYRDQLSGQNTHITIFKPNGQIRASFDHAPTGFTHYASSYWYNSITIPTGDSTNSGIWTFQTQYQGITTQHKFYVDFVNDIFIDGFE